MLATGPEGQEVLFFQRPTLKLLERLLRSLLKPTAHRRLAQAKPVNELARPPLRRIPFDVALRKAQQDRLRDPFGRAGPLHRLVAFQRPLLARLDVSNARHVRRNSCAWHALPVDANRAGVAAPPAMPLARLFAAMAGAGERFDFFVHNLGGQKTGHLGVAGKQLQLYLDRLIEDLP